jgi:two-component system, chemotaxis family, sensor kinase Cph1
VANLNRYERPIQTPGAIQPHGVLLVLEEPSYQIVQLSQNTQQYLGLTPRQLKGQPLNRLLDQDNLQRLQASLPEETGTPQFFHLSIVVDQQRQSFDAVLHRTSDALILELEQTDPPTASHFVQVQALVTQTIARMHYTTTLLELLQVTVEGVQALTGFDRVHIYRFDEQQAGEVIAEVKRADLSTYLGLHFPEIDIPEASRALYGQGLLRYVPDVQAQPIKLTPLSHPKTKQPLDLGAAILRCMDPCCVEYYGNMGSASALVISLMKDGQLWGLISCHHQTPRFLSSQVRSAFGLLAHVTSLELGNKIRQEDLDARDRLNALHGEVIQAIAKTDNLADALTRPSDRILDLVNAQGAAICLGTEMTLVGVTPSQEEVQALLDLFEALVSEDIFWTDSLATLYPEAATFQESASGVLLLRISKVQRYCILWFRPEVLQSVNWGGRPQDAFTLSEGKMRLTPRASFDLWQETVRATALPWQRVEIESAQHLKTAIVGIVLKKAEELARLNQELEQSNRELAAFSYSASHDLKEPLRGIYNYSSILQEDYCDRLDEEGLEYLQTIMRLAQRMELLINSLLRLSQLRQEDLTLQPTDLNLLVAQNIEMLKASRPEIAFEVRIPNPLPTVSCAPDLVGEVFSNLIRNAIKYNDQSEKWVELGVVAAAQSAKPEAASQDPIPVIFYVRDNGIGIRSQHQEIIFKLFKRLHSQEMYGGGAGAGLAIVKQIIERHGGWIWLESTFGEGTTFYFTLD